MGGSHTEGAAAGTGTETGNSVKVRLFISEQLGGDHFCRDVRLPAVPRMGDVLWVDVDPPMPSMKRLHVRTVEWFERYEGDLPGVVVRCTVEP